MKIVTLTMPAALCGLMLLAGCAAQNTNISFSYLPFVKATGSGGIVHVAQAPSVIENQPPALWIIGKTQNGDGERISDITIGTPPTDLVAAALVEELQAAGYTVKRVTSMPADAPKGVTISAARMSLEQTSTFVKLDASGSISASFEIWKEGRKIQGLEFLASSSDTAVGGRDLLGQQLMQNVLKDLMKQAVPTVVKSLDQN